LFLNLGLEGFSARGMPLAIAETDLIDLGLARGLIEKRSIGSVARAMIHPQRYPFFMRRDRFITVTKSPDSF